MHTTLSIWWWSLPSFHWLISLFLSSCVRLSSRKSRCRKSVYSHTLIWLIRSYSLLINLRWYITIYYLFNQQTLGHPGLIAPARRGTLHNVSDSVNMSVHLNVVVGSLLQKDEGTTSVMLRSFFYFTHTPSLSLSLSVSVSHSHFHSLSVYLLWSRCLPLSLWCWQRVTRCLYPPSPVSHPIALLVIFILF